MICIPIVGPTQEQALQDIPSAEQYGDLLELRLDLIENANLEELLRTTSKPVIVTNRTKREGGQFKGSEKERVEVLRKAMALGVDFIDIEASTPREFLQPLLETASSTQKILSYHHFSLTPDTLEAFYEVMSETPADILKLVTYAKALTDNTVIFNLLRRAKKESKKLIALCMGDLGEISRILSPLMGGFLTFGSLDAGKESAPGQLTASTLRDIYRVNEDRPYKIYGVIGDPVNKSMGYLIHNQAFKQTGLPHIYLPFWVQDVPKFFSAFEPFFDGLSVTMPHKEKIMTQLDRIDEAAQKIGAVNTVVREKDQWVGYNTDCTGALKALESRVKIENKEVLIIGSGGTAKAIGYGIVKHGGKLTVSYNQNRERGEALAKELNCKLCNVRDLENQTINILINCSPVGMAPHVVDTPYPAPWLKPEMVVFDSVYNPMETQLVKDAKAAGCTAIPGVELFINQAAEQFELWTHQKAPVEAMRKVVVEKLRNPPQTS